MPSLRRRSNVSLVGTVVDIDQEKRDVIIRTSGNDDEPVDITVHFWTTFEDARGAWRSEDDWREYIVQDSVVRIDGYLGNNGRVVVAPYHAFDYSEENLPDENSVQCVGKVVGNHQIETQTPGGKRVYVDVENTSMIENIEHDTWVALVGRKTKDKIYLLAARAIQEDSLSF